MTTRAIVIARPRTRAIEVPRPSLRAFVVSVGPPDLTLYAVLDEVGEPMLTEGGGYLVFTEN